MAPPFTSAHTFEDTTLRLSLRDITGVRLAIIFSRWEGETDYIITHDTKTYHPVWHVRIYVKLSRARVRRKQRYRDVLDCVSRMGWNMWISADEDIEVRLNQLSFLH